MNMATQLPSNLKSFIWHFLRPYKKIVFYFVFLSATAGLWGPLNSVFVKWLIDALPSAQNGSVAPLILPGVLLVLNFIVFDNFTWRSVDFFNYKYQAVIKNAIIKETMENVLTHTHCYFQDNLSGRISHQINNLADHIEKMLHRFSMDFIRAASVLLISLAVASSVNGIFFYIIGAWFVTFFTISLVMSKYLVQFADKHAKSEGKLSGQLVDCIGNSSSVRIFARKEFELFRLRKYFLGVLKKFQKKQIFVMVMYAVQGGLIATMVGLSVSFLIYLYGKGQVNVGDFALILGLVMRLGHMMWYTMARVDDFHQSIGRCRQSLSSLIIPVEKVDEEKAPKLQVEQGKISFQNVRFHYENTSDLFQNKTVTINPGEKVGLVGYSGGGKTTFVNLILRLYDVQSGKIYIDGQDISTVSINSLRNSIATIPQDAALFQRRLRDNIGYGDVNASEKQVIEAAKKAYAHEFIKQLPEGYDSYVGERGVKLSGGQRQRIAIARAILKNAPILILDEATSQLDSLTEKKIQRSLMELMEGKTSIVIAHRLSTLKNMDRIIVFDDGNIVEDGSHQELLQNGGMYKALWDAQVGGFLPTKETNENGE